jgi:hypothetical protein
MKKLVLFATFLLLTRFASSQELVLASDKYPELKYDQLKGEVFYSAYRQIKGNAYLTTDWCLGTIFLKNGEKMPAIQFKLDAYSHRLIIYQEYLKRLVIPDLQDIAGFSFMDGGVNRIFKLTDVDLPAHRSLNHCFLEVFGEGNISLYRLFLREKLPLKNPEMPYLDEFIEQSEYYIYYDGKYNIARLRRSYLIAEFPQFKSEIKAYAREKHLRLKQEKDFSVMIKYIGELRAKQ